MEGLTNLLAGAGILYMAVFTPFAVFRLFAFVDPTTDAGASFRDWLHGLGVDSHGDPLAGQGNPVAKAELNAAQDAFSGLSGNGSGTYGGGRGGGGSGGSGGHSTGGDNVAESAHESRFDSQAVAAEDIETMAEGAAVAAATGGAGAATEAGAVVATEAGAGVAAETGAASAATEAAASGGMAAETGAKTQQVAPAVDSDDLSPAAPADSDGASTGNSDATRSVSRPGVHDGDAGDAPLSEPPGSEAVPPPSGIPPSGSGPTTGGEGLQPPVVGGAASFGVEPPGVGQAPAPTPTHLGQNIANPQYGESQNDDTGAGPRAAGPDIDHLAEASPPGSEQPPHEPSDTGDSSSRGASTVQRADPGTTAAADPGVAE